MIVFIQLQVFYFFLSKQTTACVYNNYYVIRFLT